MKKKENISFEEALKKLENLVQTMEHGELPLDKLVENYEEGTKLVTFCQEKINKAELKVKKIQADKKVDFE